MTLCLPFVVDERTGSVSHSVSFKSSTAMATSLSERYKMNDLATNSLYFEWRVDPGYFRPFKLPSNEKILKHIISSIKSAPSNQHPSPINKTNENT